MSTPSESHDSEMAAANLAAADSRGSGGDDDGEDGKKRRRSEAGENPSSPIGTEGNEFSDPDMNGLICSICFEVWTSNGEHQICCLPCGHLYGMSCIKKWIEKEGFFLGKCPQCNIYCSMMDVRKLYVPHVIAVDEQVHQRLRSLEEKSSSLKRIKSLEDKCAALENEGDDLRKKEAAWKERETVLLHQVKTLQEINTRWQQLAQNINKKSKPMDENVNSERKYECERNWGPKSDEKGSKSLQKESKSHEKGSFCNFEIQNTFHVDGALLFDMDTSNDVLLIARKPKALGGVHLLTKMSLISPFEMEDILLSCTTNEIRDLHISPSNSRLALYASLGKKLSVLSLDSSDIVVNYNLQSPAWSCSWDLNSTNYIYAGLENGSVMVFDLRQTSGPVKSLVGLTRNPVHTVQSLLQTPTLPSDARTILSASDSGICQWNIDSEDGPFIVPQTDKQGVCTSLAYCSTSDDFVGSYHLRLGLSCSHVLFKRMGSHDFQKMGSTYTVASKHALPSKGRPPKCAIIDMKEQGRVFAYGDQFSSDLLLYELPSFRILEQFKMPAQARDVRYSASHGILGCLSENTIQLSKKMEKE